MAIALEPQEEARLAEAAEARGMTMTSLVRQAVDRFLEDTPARQRGSDTRPIWEIIRENMKELSPEELAKSPGDGAAQHDHYLYGAPKRY